MPGKRGPKIPPLVRRYIATEALDSNKPRELLAADIREKLLSKGSVRSVPSEETIVRLISEARNNEDREGQPWSMAVLSQWSASHRVTKVLLAIWWWCRIVGRPFTVREAKWVVRLVGVVDFKELLFLAARYATRERASELLKRPAPYFEDMDGYVGLESTFKEWWNTNPIFMAAEMTETVPTSAVGYLRELGLLHPETATTKQRILLATFVGGGADQKWLKMSPGQAVEYRLGLKCDHARALPTSVDAIYAMWLRRFSTGRGWGAIANEAKLAIAHRLHEELATWWEKRSQAPERVEELGGIPSQSAEDEEKVFRWYMGVDHIYEPSADLLAQVGIESRLRKGGQP